MPNGSAVRRARVHVVVWTGPILAGGAESENIPSSDRERGEGFQLSGIAAVRALSAVVVPFAVTTTASGARAFNTRDHLRSRCRLRSSDFENAGHDLILDSDIHDARSDTPNPTTEPLPQKRAEEAEQHDGEDPEQDDHDAEQCRGEGRRPP